MKKILVPCDFSGPAREAFEFAIQMAIRSRGEIIVLHSIITPSMYDPYFVRGYDSHNSSSYIDGFSEKAKNEFAKMKDNIGDPGIPINLEIFQGDLIPTINHVVGLWNIDLIIMGTSGASGLQEILIGSNTEKAVRHSKVPVLTISTAPEISSIKNILLPSILDLNQTELMGKVRALQDFFKATLHVLSVTTPLHFRPETEEKAALDNFAKYYHLRDHFLYSINDWSEELGIVNFAREHKMDLIAMATHSRKGLAHLFNGSITEDLINHIKYPVWTFSTNP